MLARYLLIFNYKKNICIFSFTNSKTWRETDMEDNESELACYRREIVDYLRKNPNAGDSLEGVMSWWLSSANKSVDALGIEDVLEQLITEGHVKKIHITGGTVLYRKNDPSV